MRVSTQKARRLGAHVYLCRQAQTDGQAENLMPPSSPLDGRKHSSKYFFLHRVVSRWNLLDDITADAKTANGFKSKLEKEWVEKLGLFVDWCSLDSQAVTEVRTGHPASIMQVFSGDAV